MTDAYIISKMNEYMFQLNAQIGGWLTKKLPKITDDWWQELVLNNLSLMQKDTVINRGITDISGLDLAAVLRIVDRNWFSITSMFFINNKERANIKNMMGVCNTWAHIAPTDISKKRVIEDVETIMALMRAFESSIHETRDMENFIFDIGDDDDIQIQTSKKDVSKSKQMEKIAITGIEVGSMVRLVSDYNAIGAVIGKAGNKYKVIINGKKDSYYEEQLELVVEEDEPQHVSLQRVRTALTAYQISNPGSSSLYSLNSARIDFVPYQFRPALKMIKADIPRLLVADDVGVGKTIEAGLILKEMEARSNIQSVLIVCPRPLVAERKWELEMKRFDENFVQMDGRMLIEAINEMHRDQAWPERFSKMIVPYSLFGEDMIEGTNSTSNKKRKNLGLAELDPIPQFDLVIVDEAHNIRNSNTWAYKGVEMFCRNADAVVFLTATPLQNSNKDLFTLLNLLRPDVVIDPDTFETMTEPNGYINALLRIVRTQEEGWQEAGREQIGNILNTSWGRSVIQHNPDFERIYAFLEKDEVTREEKVEMIYKIESLHSFHELINRTRRRDIEDFCIRRTQTVQTNMNSVQRDLYETVIDFESRALSMMHGSRSVRFMMCTLMRQAASCIYGLAPFLQDLINKRMDQVQEDGELFEYDFELNDDDGNGLFELADEIDYLVNQLPEVDPKFEKMYEVIREKQNDENNRVIIFSSFRHTLRYICNSLVKRGIRVGQVDGSVPDEERFNLRQRFMKDRDSDDAIDVLLFSEVGCEGLDYQFCDTMINYDLPWNPMRIEQRIGRIDRRGQKSDTVRIYNMITEGTIDATVYYRCLNKIGVFESSIGACSEILGDISEQIMRIMFEPGLTEAERNMKIEKMADNEVMKVQEIQRLEQEEKSLYGFDLSNFIQNKDVQDAENMWITPQSIQEMVEMFLSDYLDEGVYIRGKSELKSLRLAQDKRKKLLEHLKTVKITNINNASRLWKSYLKSTKPTLQVTFDSLCAKDNRDVTFLTQMHPLVIQAATFESNELPCEVGVSINSDELPSGDYEFLIYVWKYKGLRPDIRLVAVSYNEVVQNNILNYLQYSSEYEFVDDEHEEAWEKMDQLHYVKWQEAKIAYTIDVQKDCSYRLEQLGHSFNKREIILRDQIKMASDERIARMRQSQLDKLISEFEDQKNRLESTVKHVDIHTNLQVRGVLHVE